MPIRSIRYPLTQLRHVDQPVPAASWILALMHAFFSRSCGLSHAMLNLIGVRLRRSRDSRHTRRLTMSPGITDHRRTQSGEINLPWPVSAMQPRGAPPRPYAGNFRWSEPVDVTNRLIRDQFR